jgi:RNA polymerase sigma-70 factor (ECF subfamily)
MALSDPAGDRQPDPSERRSGSLTDLVAGIRNGDQTAADEFVHRYWRGVMAIIGHSCSDRSVVEDLRQETLRIALEKIREGAIRDPERLSGFVASLARNLVIQHFRRAEPRHEELDDRTVAAAEARLPGPAADPLQQLLLDEEAALVRHVLDELPTERDRQILIRRYLEERDKDEVCAELGLTSDHFNRVLFRARNRYRELYRREVEEKRRAR